MPDEPKLQIHIRLKSGDLRQWLDDYCERNHWSLTTAMNVILDKARAEDESRSHPTTPPQEQQK